MTQLLGIDTGGTFTDFILYKNGNLFTHKILSTPHAPEQAILQGLRALDIDLSNAHLVHGTTVATNTLLEGKGACTAFISNRGCKDLLHIGRQTRDQLYSLCPRVPRQLIPPQLCFEVAGRIAADGRQLEQITSDDITQLQQQLAQQPVEAVAICMLFSFLNDADEVELSRALEKQYFVSRSSELLPEQREYERAVVTWLNSYLGPHTRKYLHDLQKSIDSAYVHVMQSDATTLPVAAAGDQAVKLLLSGPAGGVVAATTVAAQTKYKKLLTLDMGGTSTDVALIDEKAARTNEGKVAEFPLAISMLDIHTIGAGGGSIARVDQAGVLHVGPESAGANPGPACYGQGGHAATITDANVVLGRLPVSDAWTSGLGLHKAAAERSLANLAVQLKCSLQEAAQGVIELANAHMAQALRVISIHRGYDPSEFCLFPFGGAGGLHMCEVAELLDMNQILVAANPGILSAYGMLHAPIGQSASRSVCQDLSEFNPQDIDSLLRTLAHQSSDQLQNLNLQPDRYEYWLDLRYRGQSATISIAWSPDIALDEAFSQIHQSRFGFRLPDNQAIELVTARAWAYQDVPQVELPALAARSPGAPLEFVEVAACPHPVPVFRRTNLAVGQQIEGPSIVVEDSSTLFISCDWLATVQRQGHIHLGRDTDCH